MTATQKKYGLLALLAFILYKMNAASETDGAAPAAQPAATPMAVRGFSVLLPTGEQGEEAREIASQGQTVRAQIDERARTTAESTESGRAALDAQRRVEQAVSEAYVSADQTTAGAIRFATFGS